MSSKDPDRSRNACIKQAKRALAFGRLCNFAGASSLLALLGLAITGNFKDSTKYAICLYLISAIFLFVGNIFIEKHKDIQKKINTMNRYK